MSITEAMDSEILKLVEDHPEGFLGLAGDQGKAILYPRLKELGFDPNEQASSLSTRPSFLKKQGLLVQVEGLWLRTLLPYENRIRPVTSLDAVLAANKTVPALKEEVSYFSAIMKQRNKQDKIPYHQVELAARKRQKLFLGIPTVPFAAETEFFHFLDASQTIRHGKPTFKSVGMITDPNLNRLAGHLSLPRYSLIRLNELLRSKELLVIQIDLSESWSDTTRQLYHGKTVELVDQDHSVLDNISHELSIRNFFANYRGECIIILRFHRTSGRESFRNGMIGGVCQGMRELKINYPRIKTVLREGQELIKWRLYKCTSSAPPSPPAHALAVMNARPKNLPTSVLWRLFHR